MEVFVASAAAVSYFLIRHVMKPEIMRRGPRAAGRHQMGGKIGFYLQFTARREALCYRDWAGPAPSFNRPIGRDLHFISKPAKSKVHFSWSAIMFKNINITNSRMMRCICSWLIRNKFKDSSSPSDLFLEACDPEDFIRLFYNSTVILTVTGFSNDLRPGISPWLFTFSCFSLLLIHLGVQS